MSRMKSQDCVVGVFESLADAQEAVNELEDRGLE